MSHSAAQSESCDVCDVSTSDVTLQRLRFP
jgi:hypothetical protein